MGESGERLRVMLFDCAGLWRGAEQQVLFLAAGLRSRGVEVHVACHPAGELWGRLPSEIPRLPLVMRNDLDLFSLPRVLRYCRQHRIQVLAGHGSRDHSITGFVRLLDKRRALVVHRCNSYPLSDNLGNRLLYKSGYVHTFIAVCKSAAQVLANFGVDPTRIVTIRCGVDTSSYRAQCRQTSRAKILEETGAPSDAVLVGAVAALSPEKGHDTLIKALKILQENQILFHCVIAGEGSCASAIRNQIQESDLNRAVTMLGFRKDVPFLLAGLDVLVLTSLVEGVPIVLMEGMHLGDCVVATGAGGIPEIVKDGETGLLSRPGDEKGLARNLARVIQDPVLRAELAANGRSRAERDFCLDTMVDATLDIYRKAASETARVLGGERADI